MSLNQLAKEAHAMALEKGWYDTDRGFPELIALCHSELSEALEEYREGMLADVVYYNPPFNGPPAKPEGIPIELAGLLIRVFDLAGFYGIDLDGAVEEKMAYNKTRPYRHGDRRA